MRCQVKNKAIYRNLTKKGLSEIRKIHPGSRGFNNVLRIRILNSGYKNGKNQLFHFILHFIAPGSGEKIVFQIRILKNYFFLNPIRIRIQNSAKK
jgi:hypothetical protein